MKFYAQELFGCIIKENQVNFITYLPTILNSPQGCMYKPASSPQGCLYVKNVETPRVLYIERASSPQGCVYKLQLRGYTKNMIKK